MANILYISLTGMTESLGKSQVIQYLQDLAKTHSIYLLSFEKGSSKENLLNTDEALKKVPIKWKYFYYTNRYGVLSSGWQIFLSFIFSIYWIKTHKINIIHARSFIPGFIALLLKKILNVSLLYDMRGFAIDEKIMDGRLKEYSILTWILRKLEFRIYQNANHVVTLTHVSKPILVQKYKIQFDKITVIPTCANSKLFTPVLKHQKEKLKVKIGFNSQDFIIVHSGSLNSWIDFDAQIKLFKELITIIPNSKLLFLNNGQYNLIVQYLNKYEIKNTFYKILDINFEEVSHYLNAGDLCIFFIKPVFAKQGSSPTKFAEIVACHIHSITNTDYGDMEYYIDSYQVGMLLNLKMVHQTPKEMAKKVTNYITNNMHGSAAQFDLLFNNYFSKEIGVEKYGRIYDSLSKKYDINIQK